MDKIKKIFRWILPIYWAFLTYMLLRPSIENHNLDWLLFDGLDKVVHLSIFAILGFLIKGTCSRMSFYYFILITLSYAFLTEILQDEMGLGRTGEFLDIVADVIGVVLGYWAYRIFEKIYSKL